MAIAEYEQIEDPEHRTWLIEAARSRRTKRIDGLAPVIRLAQGTA
jgi:hypothetical protein